jgi:DNA modification methylase
VTLVIVHRDDWLTLYNGDWLDVLRELAAESVHCVVTSPPYWGLRDYGHIGQLGLEPTPEAYVARLVEGFREVRRVLRKDGTLWLNLGDSYISGQGGRQSAAGACRGTIRQDRPIPKARPELPNAPAGWAERAVTPRTYPAANNPYGWKPKDLAGIPWRVAFALQVDGWYLRSDVIWAKPNPKPESVTDRPTRAHEYLFLLSKSPRYFFDADAVREPALWPDGPNSPESIKSPHGQGFTRAAGNPTWEQRKAAGAHAGGHGPLAIEGSGTQRNVHGNGLTHDLGSRTGRNLRSVWTIATEPYPGAHFATFPQRLVEPCILAGCPVGGTVLDCFAGSGTTGLVAERLGRRSILIELSADYAAQAMERIAGGRRDGTGPALDLPLPAPEGSLWDVPA